MSNENEEASKKEPGQESRDSGWRWQEFHSSHPHGMYAADWLCGPRPQENVCLDTAVVNLIFD